MSKQGKKYVVKPAITGMYIPLCHPKYPGDWKQKEFAYTQKAKSWFRWFLKAGPSLAIKGNA